MFHITTRWNFTTPQFHYSNVSWFRRSIMLRLLMFHQSWKSLMNSFKCQFTNRSPIRRRLWCDKVTLFNVKSRLQWPHYRVPLFPDWLHCSPRCSHKLKCCGKNGLWEWLDLCFKLVYKKSSIVNCCKRRNKLYEDQMFQYQFCDHLHQSEWRLEGVSSNRLMVL